LYQLFLGSDENIEQLENLSQISRPDSEDYQENPSSGLSISKSKRRDSGVDERLEYAVKIIRSRDEEYQTVALKEYHLLKKLEHPGVINMVDAFVNKSSHSIYLVMELIKGVSL
jgi:serine/threonine protein kinase